MLIRFQNIKPHKYKYFNSKTASRRSIAGCLRDRSLHILCSRVPGRSRLGQHQNHGRFCNTIAIYFAFACCYNKQHLHFQLKVCPKRVCISTVGVRTDLYPKDPNHVRITDFFGSIRPTEVSTHRINITLNVPHNPEEVPNTIEPIKKYIFHEQFPSHLFAKE